MPDLLPKPRELTSLYQPAKRLFQTLQEAFQVPDTFVLHLAEVDNARNDLTDIVARAALTMRKVQALRLTAESGYRTTSDVVIGLAADLHRSLEELAVVLLAHQAADSDKHAAVLISIRNKIDVAARVVGMLGGSSGESIVELL